MMRTVEIGRIVQPVSSWNPNAVDLPCTFKYVDLGAVDQSEKRVSSATEIMTGNAPSRARQLVRAGDVLVSTVRPNLNGVALVPNELDGATASTGFCVLRATKELDPAYLFHWVQSPQFVSDMSRKATGQSYPAVSDKIIKSSHMPLPMLGAQRRIADVLDRADKLRAKRRQSIALLDDLAQSIFLDMFGDPIANPRGWRRVKFRSVLDAIESGTSPKCLDRPAGEGEYGVLKLGAVTKLRYNSAENKALPPGAAPNVKVEVKAGDILFSRKNTLDLVAAAVFVESTPPKMLMPDLIFRFKIDEGAELDKRYLHRLLIHPTKRRAIQDLAGGSASSMSNISKSRLENIMIELPPLDIQRDFADAIQALDVARQDSLRHLAQLDALFASLQSRAFAGDLWKDDTKHQEGE